MPRPLNNEDIEPLREMAYRFALRFTGKDADADDIAQEAITALWKNAPSVEERIAWLYRVVHNLSLTQYRRSKRESSAKTGYAATQLTDHSSAEEALEAYIDGKLGVISTLLSRLNDTEREMVIARIQDGQTFHEIGRKIGISHESVRQKVQKALLKLRRPTCAASSQGNSNDTQ